MQYLAITARFVKIKNSILNDPHGYTQCSPMLLLLMVFCDILVQLHQINPQADRILKYTISGWPKWPWLSDCISYVFERVVVSILNSDWLQPYRSFWCLSIYPTQARKNDVITAGFRGFPSKSHFVYIGDDRWVEKLRGGWITISTFVTIKVIYICDVIFAKYRHIRTTLFTANA